MDLEGGCTEGGTTESSLFWTVDRVIGRSSWILIWRSARSATLWTIRLLGINCRYDRVVNTLIHVLEVQSRGPPRTAAY